MARERLVTRTIVGTKAEVMVLNIPTEQTHKETVVIGARKFKDEKALLKAIQKVFDTEENKAIHILSTTEVSEKRAMKEDEFIARSYIMEQ